MLKFLNETQEFPMETYKELFKVELFELLLTLKSDHGDLILESSQHHFLRLHPHSELLFAITFDWTDFMNIKTADMLLQIKKRKLTGNVKKFIINENRT